MTVIHCRHVMAVTQNLFRHIRNPNANAISPVTPYFKRLHTKVQNPMPVKLAYASYESMKDTENTSKPPIIIMHGLFGSKNNWSSLSKAIHQKTERKVITIDARNHGDSPHSPEMSYKHMAEDVTQLMNDLGFQKAVLVGHSMGGSTMMYTALHYPELVEKLIVVDMSPVRVSPSLTEMSTIFQAMRSVKVGENVCLSKARRIADEQLASIVKSVALRQFLMMNLVEAESGSYKWRINLPVLEQSFTKQIAKFPNAKDKVYRGPTLFIGGAKSDYIQIKDQPAIKKLFPSAEFQYIADARHWVHADKPAEFLNILTTFVNQTQISQL